MRPYHLVRVCLAFVAAAAVSSGGTARAQSPVPRSATTILVPMNENFTALGNVPPPTPTPIAVLPGWAAYSYTNPPGNPPPANPTFVATAVADNGSTAGPNVYNYGTGGDRALGVQDGGG